MVIAGAFLRTSATRRRAAVLIFLVLTFIFRLAYGLSSTFWSEDERQVYLIGLRSYARGEWPYFGPDVVWTGGQLPGALQGLLVRGPLQAWPIPEAPFVLLNLLSFAALVLLAWYCTRRFADVPAWLVWGWLLTLPWTLNFSTHVVNVSYILPGATMFFVGFFEAAPTFRAGILSHTAAWTLMGAGLLFVVQLHMSWVLLPPYVLFAGLDLLRRNPALAFRAAAGFLAGASATGSLLLPTLLEYGPLAGGADRAVELHSRGLSTLLTILARFFSFTAFETNRFLGLNTAERLLFFWRQPWVVPFAVLVTVIGLLQPVAMAMAWFMPADRSPEWKRMRYLVAITVLWIYTSFFFSVRGPLAHAFYVAMPVAVVYACHCWRLFASAWLARVAAATLVAGVFLHAGLAIDRAPRTSLYLDRALVQAAISVPNDRFLGDRRRSWQLTPDRAPRTIDRVEDAEAFRRADPVADLEVVAAEWSPVLAGRVSRLVLSVRNRSRVAAYLDIRYATQYTGANGQIVATREGVIKEILQPGKGRTWTNLTDGLSPAGATLAAVTILSAEKCIPAR